MNSHIQNAFALVDEIGQFVFSLIELCLTRILPLFALLIAQFLLFCFRFTWSIFVSAVTASPDRSVTGEVCQESLFEKDESPSAGNRQPSLFQRSTSISRPDVIAQCVGNALNGVQALPRLVVSYSRKRFSPDLKREIGSSVSNAGGEAELPPPSTKHAADERQAPSRQVTHTPQKEETAETMQVPHVLPPSFSVVKRNVLHSTASAVSVPPSPTASITNAAASASAHRGPEPSATYAAASDSAQRAPWWTALSTAAKQPRRLLSSSIRTSPSYENFLGKFRNHFMLDR
ncbi:hypothetical protein KP509_37G018400 [Ceratopteris richardii]|uniref:Uncharacterized protein n=1 Tax=Ceratopteris richardii TaxID=49495 RepID=A0A8T2Q709_CERRI|nr:hypothetical protein KP509_37G018400 [Ceratopteris richardii]